MNNIAYLDTETHPISPGNLSPKPVCLQFAVNDGDIGVAVCAIDPVEEIFREILLDKSMLIVGHNIAYDILVLLREYPNLTSLIFSAYLENRITDTMIREKLILIAKGSYWRLRGNGFSLATVSKRYKVVKDKNDPWRLRYNELANIPFSSWPEAAKIYAVNDVFATRAVYLGQATQVDELPDQYHQARAAFALHCTSAAGVFTDPKAIQEFELIQINQHNEDKQLLSSTNLLRPTGARNMEAGQARMKKVMEAVGVEPRKTKTGRISLDEEACLKANDPILEAFQRYGNKKRLITRIQSLKLGVSQPINPYFDSLVETGRTSCRKGTPGAHTNGYQVQNMQRATGERECFIPRPGNVFCSCDFDTMELRTLAQCCLWTVGYSKLGEAIKAGLDPHLALAASILVIPYEEALDPNHPKRSEIDNARQGCKIANFGYPGGMGTSAFRGYAKGYGMNLTERQAMDLKEGWLATWEEMEGYFNWIAQLDWREEVRGEYIKSVTDIEQFISRRKRASITYTVACNSFFQGLAADAAKASAFAITQAIEMGELRGWQCWNFVHDEFILEGPEADGDRAAKLVAKIMVEAAQSWVPDIPLSASPCLMRRWSKKAKPVYKEGGVLVPWE